ncbi:MAG: hypothetical protein ACHWZW_06035 [Spirulina sp.]
MPSEVSSISTLGLSAIPIELMKPMAVDSTGAPAPENSEVCKIANDILQAAQYSFAAVAANPDLAVRPGSLEADFKEAIGRVSAERKANFQVKAVSMTSAPQSVREIMFGRYGTMSRDEFIGVGGFERAHENLSKLSLDTKLLGVRIPQLTVPSGGATTTSEGLLIPAANLPKGYEDFEEVIEGASEEATKSGVYNTQKLDEIWGPVYTRDPYINMGSHSSDFEEQAVTDKLGFYITRIKCVDETNPEWWGSDEIALAGISTDEDGDTKKINEVYIGGGFDDGDQRTYSPSWFYNWFSMQEGKYWPKKYIVALLLAEKDNGGLSDILNTVWNNVRDKVKAAISNAIGSGLSSYLGPALAKAIGEAVAWIVDKLVGWIINAFKDDVFPPFIASCTVPSFSARWNYSNGTWGSTTSPITTAHFYGHGGHYLINYYWRLYA